MAKEGDNKSKIFHAKASHRIRQNRIETLKNDEGEWLEVAWLDDHIVIYFNSIFSANEERGPIQWSS